MADIMISAGEASGDLHGANLAKALKRERPDLRIVGMGSSEMRSADVELLVDSKDIGVMGLVEVIKYYPKIRGVLNQLKRYIDDNRPKVLVLIDYVEFNLKLAKYAKSKGVKVLFYVSPQVWAWREGRVPKIGEAIDHMAVIFPFETKIYEQHNIPVTYVGHPLADEVKPTLERQEIFDQLALNQDMKICSILPGSREGEIAKNLPVLLDAVEQLASSHDSIQFVLPVAPTLDVDAVTAQVSMRTSDVKVVATNVYNLLSITDSAIVASGTATLQTALLGVPMSIMYRVNALSYMILSRLVKIDHIGLANIVAGHEVVPEFIQDQATGANLAREAERQLFDKLYNTQMRENLEEVKRKIGEGGCSDRVAALALSLMTQR